MAKKIKIQHSRKVAQTCPVCRSKKIKLTIHHILPRYIFKNIMTDERSYFLNGCNSYWMCSRCHSKYERKYANILRDSLLDTFKYPKICESRVTKVESLVKMKNLCRFLTGKFHKNKYNYSIYEAYNYIKKVHNKKYMCYDDIEFLSKMDDYVLNPNFIDSGIFLTCHISVQELDYLYRESLIEFLEARNVRQGNFIPKINKYYGKVTI